MIEKKELIIGIVLFNPELNILNQNLKFMNKNGYHVVLIDNGSNNLVEIKNCLKEFDNTVLISNHENKGIAYALNSIIDFAKNNKYSWILTLDQDSMPNEDMLNKMMESALPTYSIVCPRLVDCNVSQEIRNGKIVYDTKKSNLEFIKNPKEIMTSGCMMNIKVFEKVGKFDDKLFIDYVDVDYNIRVLEAGLKIVRVNDAILAHQLGESTIKKFLGHSILVDNHNSMRRYYITRNRLYIAKKYYKDKGYKKELLKVVLSGIKIVLYENDKMNKVKAIFKGIKDAKNL